MLCSVYIKFVSKLFVPVFVPWTLGFVRTKAGEATTTVPIRCLSAQECLLLDKRREGGRGNKPFSWAALCVSESTKAFLLGDR